MTTDTTNYGFSTQAIHTGQQADPTTGALITLIFQTATFVLEELGVNKGYQYARSHNPTRTALEESLAALENAKFGLATSSGLAAASTVLNTLSCGDHVICGEDVYGGVFRLFEQVYRRFGIEFSYVDARNLDTLEEAITSKTKLVWIESPTNPLLRLADIEGISKITKKHKLTFVVDNTFATPYLQKPISLGADIVIHSTTKYISGHSDVIGGAVITSNEELYEDLKFNHNAVGAVPGPFDCFLVLRGLKTLSARIKEHERNATTIAQYLEKHPEVESVYYPGLKSHPQHELARSQMKGYGGVVSFVLKGGQEAAKHLVNNTKLFQLAESLGGVKSLICQPASMTHKPIPKEIREKSGIVDGLIRLSVGLEEVEDLVKDLDSVLCRNVETRELACSGGAKK